MASDDLLTILVGAGAVALAGWLIGNQLENAGKAIGSGIGKIGEGITDTVVNTAEAGQDLFYGVSGKVKEVPGNSMTTSKVGAGDQNPPKSVPGFSVTPMARHIIDNQVPKAEPRPVTPPEKVIVSGIEKDGFIFFPKESPALNAGQKIRMSFTEPGGLGRTFIPGSTLYDTIRSWF